MLKEVRDAVGMEGEAAATGVDQTGDAGLEACSWSPLVLEPCARGHDGPKRLPGCVAAFPDWSREPDSCRPGHRGNGFLRRLRACDHGSMGRSARIRVGTWNTMWAKPASRSGRHIRGDLEAAGCDVLCVTEGFAGIFPEAGHVIKAPQDWGYAVKDDRRKVLLWSRYPWDEVDVVGSKGLPGGRFVRAATRTAAGTTLTAVGVCIPWRDAHCTTGRKDRKRWQDHRTWLEEFGRLRSQLPAKRLVVLGDFNQRIPRRRVPLSVHEALQLAFAGLEIATAGDLPEAPKQVIDHIAHSSDLKALGVRVWQDRDPDGRRLSDHLGTWVEFGLP